MGITESHHFASPLYPYEQLKVNLMPSNAPGPSGGKYFAPYVASPGRRMMAGVITITRSWLVSIAMRAGRGQCRVQSQHLAVTSNRGGG